jgi:hypothetical protein
MIAEALFKWLLFFLIGVAYIYNAVFHVIFHETAADYIGWVDSPFQIELGFASFGIGIVGLLATWRSFDVRLAAVLSTASFLWGAAGVHIHSMITDHNFEPGNAGVIFWTDIVIPLIGFILLWLQRRCESAMRRPCLGSAEDRVASSWSSQRTYRTRAAPLDSLISDGLGSGSLKFRTVLGVRLALELVASGRKLRNLRLSDGKHFSGALSHRHRGLCG